MALNLKPVFFWHFSLERPAKTRVCQFLLLMMSYPGFTKTEFNAFWQDDFSVFLRYFVTLNSRDFKPLENINLSLSQL